MTVEVNYGKDARAKLLEGVQMITKAVACTMGPSGRCVMIGNAFYGNDGITPLSTHVTKDGYSVTKNFKVSDQNQMRGAMAIQEAAFRTVSEAGDSTTLTCVLAESLITNGMKLIDEGANAQQIKKGLDAALEYVVDELKKLSTPVKGDNERIRQVATVSANNDEEIGKLIADAYKKIGDEGIIDIEESKGINTEIKISDGLKFEKGWVSNAFVNNRAKENCEFESPLILLYEKRITHHTQIENALLISNNSNRPLLIICEDSDEEGLAFLAMNNIQKRVQVCVVKSPEFGDARREFMEDIALLTGGTYISDTKGVGVKEVTINELGEADKITVSKTETIVIGGAGDKTDIEEFVNDLRMNLAQAKNEDEKYPIEKRIARLTGGVAVIHVGAATETELMEKMDRVDDAVRATKAAISEGYVCGAGTSFLRIGAPIVAGLPFKKESLLNGYDLLFNSLKTPLLQICINAGVNEKEILEKVSREMGNMGYNALTDKIEDLVEAGIIDSTKALRCALVNAVSVAGMVLTTECTIITTS